MRRDDRRGITLIEMLVAIFIVLLIAVVAIPAVTRWLGGDVRSVSRHLVSTLQTAYDECALQHVPMRVAYDLDERTYWVEAATGEVRLFQNQAQREQWEEDEEERAEEIERWKDLDAAAEERMRMEQDQLMGDTDSPMAGLLGMMGLSMGTGTLEPAPRLNEFVPVEDEVFKIRQLPHSVDFIGVWSPQFDDVVTRQDPPPEEDDEHVIVYTHIFPEGYMEDTVIYLDDKHGTVMSLIVEPLTGRVRAELGEAEPPDREDRNADW